MAVTLLFALFLAVAGLIVAAAAFVKTRIDVTSLILFTAFPVLLFASGFFSRDTPLPLDHLPRFPPWSMPGALSPQNPTFSDAITQFAPWAKAIRVAWKSGEVPLWNRWNGCGSPLALNGVTSAFFPLTIMAFALPLGKAVVFQAAARVLLAQAGMYMWLRELGLRPVAARFGGLAFGMSFALTPWLFNPATNSICLWPWIFFAIELLKPQVFPGRAFLFLTVLLGIWPLTGHAETVALGALFGAIWITGRAIAEPKSGFRVVSRVSAAAAIALALSAFALIPQFQVIRASNRLRLARSDNRFDFVPWVPYRPGWLGGLVTTFYPRAFGDAIDTPMTPDAAGSVVEMGFGYFGVIGLSCALLSAFKGNRSPPETLLCILGILGLAGALGLPPFRWLIEALPGIGLAPPLRFLIFVSAAGAPLAAFAVNRIVDDHDPKALSRLVRLQLGLAVGGAATFLVLYSRYETSHSVHQQLAAFALPVGILVAAVAATALAKARVITPGHLVFALTLMLGLELLIQGRRFYRYYSPARLYPDTPLVRFLRDQEPPFRIVGTGSAFFPATNIYSGLESVETQDPTERADYVSFLHKTAGYPPFDYFRTIGNLDAASLDFLNVQYLVAPVGTEKPSAKWQLVYDGLDGRVFQNGRVMPRLFAPRSLRWIDPHGNPEVDALGAFGPALEEFLRAPAFDEIALLLRDSRFTSVSPSNPDHVWITVLDESTNRVRCRVSGNAQGQPAIVISSIVNDGGWNVTADSGIALPSGFANGPFLAFSVPPGEHRITLRYRPPGLRIGLVAHGVGIVALAFVVLRGRKTRRRE